MNYASCHQKLGTVLYLVRDIKLPKQQILFSSIFSTNFSQIEQMKKKRKILVFSWIWINENTLAKTGLLHPKNAGA